MTAEATCSDCVVSAILLLLLNYHIYKYVISYVAHNCVFTISSTHVGNKVIKHAHVSIDRRQSTARTNCIAA
jgi:hypothetical protein